MAVCLIAGGAGFLGSHLAEALLARGDTVRVVDNFSHGTPANLAPQVEVIPGDIRSTRRRSDTSRAGSGTGSSRLTWLDSRAATRASSSPNTNTYPGNRGRWDVNVRPLFFHECRWSGR